MRERHVFAHETAKAFDPKRMDEDAAWGLRHPVTRCNRVSEQLHR